MPPILRNPVSQIRDVPEEEQDREFGSMQELGKDSNLRKSLRGSQA